MNHTTGTERRNARMHKIFEDARRRKVDAAYPRLVEALRDCVYGGDEPHQWAEKLLRELGEIR